ncbi:MAG: hypothetical protein QME52_05200 [Bacteroidota bacterium]|nr:hypothetical protein [Bacteroidota bacterium]
MKNLFPYYLLFILSLFLLGCPPPKPIMKEKPPTPPMKKNIVPDMVIKFATIDISKYDKKVEINEIHKFAGQLKKDSIDILTIQGIIRYPEIKTRVDIVDELAKQTEMRKAFGETINHGGRQNGNGVFSIYPIRSSDNFQFDKIKSTGFEAAIQTIIDCGAQNIVVVSTQITDKATRADRISIIKSLEQLPQQFQSYPIVISGNLDFDQPLNKFNPIQIRKNNDSPGVWFAANGTINILDEQIRESVFGKMTIVIFGIFSQPQP